MSTPDQGGCEKHCESQIERASDAPPMILRVHKIISNIFRGFDSESNDETNNFVDVILNGSMSTNYFFDLFTISAPEDAYALSHC